MSLLFWIILGGAFGSGVTKHQWTGCLWILHLKMELLCPDVQKTRFEWKLLKRKVGIMFQTRKFCSRIQPGVDFHIPLTSKSNKQGWDLGKQSLDTSNKGMLMEDWRNGWQIIKKKNRNCTNADGLGHEKPGMWPDKTPRKAPWPHFIPKMLLGRAVFPPSCKINLI